MKSDLAQLVSEFRLCSDVGGIELYRILYFRCSRRQNVYSAQIAN